VEPDVEEEAEAGVDLLEDGVGHDAIPVRDLHLGEQLARLTDRYRSDVVDAAPVDRDRQREGLETSAPAIRARHLSHVALELLALAVAVGVGVPALDPGDGAFEGGVVGPNPSEA